MFASGKTSICRISINIKYTTKQTKFFKKFKWRGDIFMFRVLLYTKETKADIIDIIKEINCAKIIFFFVINIFLQKKKNRLWIYYINKNTKLKIFFFFFA